MKLIAFLGILCLGVTITLAAEGDLYAELSSPDGSFFYTRDYLADVSSYISEANAVCGAGVWLLYENDDYNDGGSGGMISFLGSSTCTDLNFEVTSIRQAGSPTEFDKSVLTLYSYANYGGLEFYITTDLPTLGAFSDQAYSAIVTGSEPWTVYTYGDYDGYGKCLYPGSETVTVGSTSVGVGLFPTYDELGSAGLIRSVRKGCFDTPN